LGVINHLSQWAIPFLLFFIPLYGFFKGVRVYEVFVQGAEEGVKIAFRIIPYLVGMLLAVSIFWESGALGILSWILRPLIGPIGFPPELLPLALVRPISGGAALGVAADIIKTHGPDSFWAIWPR